MSTDLSDAALDELKQWLAITITRDDALLLRLIEAARELCLRFTGSEETAWQNLAQPLRHGIIRYAAHQYRERDTGPYDAPPAAVAALWRPYRRMRL